MKKLIGILIIGLMMCMLTFGHSGRTDSNGGHWDRKKGTYHYHNKSSGGSGCSMFSHIEQAP